jgi:hypothetical protein
VLPRLSKADQQKLSNHRDLVRDLQSRLVALSGSNTGTSPGPAVTLPAASAASCSGTQPRPTASQNTPGYADRWNAFIPMMTVALACDLTRVISMQGGGPGNSEAGLPAGDIHQDYAHHVDENPTAFAAMTTYHTYNGKMLLNLLRSLASVKEGNGTLLDNTLVVWEGELATGEHHFYTWPAVIFGGRNLGLATGRYVHLEQNVTAKLPYGGGTTRLGPGHNRLLVSLARLMGVSTNTVGLANVSGSVSSVDLSGPLPGIGG